MMVMVLVVVVKMVIFVKVVVRAIYSQFQMGGTLKGVDTDKDLVITNSAKYNLICNNIEQTRLISIVSKPIKL